MRINHLKAVWTKHMPITIVDLDCNIFGDFKIGDNAVYNALLLSDLVRANEDSKFSKLIVLQAASLIEVAAIQIFYRAQNFNREGVPNISREDQQAISERQIDKFAIVIDNLQKYNILSGLDNGIYNDLHKLRKYRNKIHIQLDVKITGVTRDENEQFTTSLMNWALDLNWKVLSYLSENYARPAHISRYVRPLCLPRPT